MGGYTLDEDHSATRGEAPPAWFEMSLVGALGLVLGFALIALPLAMLGAFRPYLVLPFVVLVCGATVGLWGRPTRGATTSSPWPYLAAVLLAVAFALANGALNAEHLWVDNDAGVYATTAAWLAEEGTLLVEGREDGFAAPPGAIEAGSPGFYPGREDGRLYPQFLHLFPVVLAAGEWLRGASGLLDVNAILGGLGLLAVFAFGSRFMSPWLALGASLALALTLPQVLFARDTLSEPLSQFLVFGGLWALWAARGGATWRRGLIAGLLFGATVTTRVDGLLVLACLTVVLSADLIGARGRSTWPATARLVAACAAGLLLTTAVAVLDGYFFSYPYVRDLQEQIVPLGALLGVAMVVAALGVTFAPKLQSLWASVRAHRRRMGAGAVAVVLLLAIYAAAVRPAVVNHREPDRPPAVAKVVEANQARQGLEIDGARSYSEDSVRWLVLYLGPLALIGAVGGAALSVRWLVTGRGSPLLPFLLVGGAAAFLYLWRPSIVPVHVWAMRRYLPVVLPAALLLCFLFAGWLAQWRHKGRWATAGAGALALGAVVFPAMVLLPLAGARVQGGMQAKVGELCDSLPAHSAVLFLKGEPASSLTPTVRALCRVPAASARARPSPTQLASMAASWRRAGRTLYLLRPLTADSGRPARSATVFEIRLHHLQTRIGERPPGLETGVQALALERVG